LKYLIEFICEETGPGVFITKDNKTGPGILFITKLISLLFIGLCFL
jgi:hypothetical protein